MRALSCGRESAWARRIDCSSRRDQFGRMVLQREVERCSRCRQSRHNKLMAIPNSEPAGDCLYLVKLSPWSAELGFTCPDAWRFCCAADKPRNRGWQPIAVAAAIKAFPVLAIIYLVYRRYWKAAVSLVATLLFLLFILPAPLRGFERGWHDLEKWSAGMLKYSDVTVGQRPMRSYTWKNQSLVGVSNRLLRHVDADAASAPHTPVYVNVADLNFRVVNAIIISVALALGILFIAALPRRDMRTTETDAIEFALLLLLMLMVTPLSFGYFYSWLILPFAVVTQQLLSGKGSTILSWTLPALALLALGLFFSRGAQLYGNTFFATLLLFVGLSIELLRCKKRPEQVQPAAS